MKIGKPFKKGQSGNPGGRPKVVAEDTSFDNEQSQSLPLQREFLLRTHCSTEVMADRSSTSLSPTFVIRAPGQCKTAEEWVARRAVHTTLFAIC